MRLPFLRSKATAAAKRAAPAAGGAPGSVLAARTRARQRLAGALVLLVAGVITFPLLFETQPRPLSVDTPIEVLPREPAPTAGPVPAPVPAPAPAVTPASGAMAAPAEPESEPVPAAARVPVPAPAPAPLKQAQAASMPAAAEGQAGTARFVVQAGAYGEATALREARQKVEKLGLKTYTQVIDSEAGKRTRVRVGPFATRQEAEAVAAKVKAAGLPANILTL